MFGHDDKDNKDEQANETPNVEAMIVEPDTGEENNAVEVAPTVPDVQDTPASTAPLSGHSDDLLDTSSDTNNLLDIKRDALQALSPLLGHLEQTPEERFRTTMMLIQASDNKELVKEAYEAAKGIKDDKERAQALLDVVNEINYFTQSTTA